MMQNKNAYEMFSCRCNNHSLPTCCPSLSSALEGHSPDKDFAPANLG